MSFLRVPLFTLISFYLLLHLGFCEAYQNCLVALVKITTVQFYWLAVLFAHYRANCVFPRIIIRLRISRHQDYLGFNIDSVYAAARVLRIMTKYEKLFFLFCSINNCHKLFFEKFFLTKIGKNKLFRAIIYFAIIFAESLLRIFYFDVTALGLFLLKLKKIDLKSGDNDDLKLWKSWLRS